MANLAKFTAVSLNTQDNLKIAINHYYLAKANRDKVLIICPGCFMCKDAKPFLAMSEDFSQYFDVITMDFRGHGKSGGLFTFTAKEGFDLQTVVKYAKERYKNTFVLSFSLAAATAIIYAAKHKDIDRLITVSSPADCDKIENYFFKKESLIPALESFQLGKSPMIRPGNLWLKKIKPITVIEDIAPIPTLFLHGDKDPIVFPWHSQELFKQAREPKRLVILPNGLHAQELYLKNKDKFLDICLDWYQR